jgi:hypothetical protein
VLRIASIQTSPGSNPDDPRYDIVDSARFGEESGGAEASYALSGPAIGDFLAREGVAFSAITKALKDLSETGFTEVLLEPRLGPRIVRAWFDTVFNPLIASLELELGLLRKRNWTFSFAPPMLELIRPTRDYLPANVESNLEQVKELNVPLAANSATHDAAVERLFGSVAALHAALVASPGFVDLCNSLLVREKLLELSIEDEQFIFGAYPRADRLKLIAQNVVNNLGDLPPHYSTAKFWNGNREQLLRALAFPGVREYYDSTIQVAGQLTSVSGSLLSQLKERRRNLSLRYDVPPASLDRLTA